MSDMETHDGCLKAVDELIDKIHSLQSELEDYKTRYLSAEANVTNLASQVISKDEEIERLREALQKIKTLEVSINYTRIPAEAWMRDIASEALEPTEGSE